MQEVDNATDSVRNHNVGNSDYAKHKIQPWDVWIEFQLNPFDADLAKRTLRTKAEGGMTQNEARKLDYEKIVHIASERIRQMVKEAERQPDYILADVKELHQVLK